MTTAIVVFSAAMLPILCYLLWRLVKVAERVVEVLERISSTGNGYQDSTLHVTAHY